MVGSVPLPQESDSDQEYLYDDYNQDGVSITKHLSLQVGQDYLAYTPKKDLPFVLILPDQPDHGDLHV